MKCSTGRPKLITVTLRDHLTGPCRAMECSLVSGIEMAGASMLSPPLNEASSPTLQKSSVTPWDGDTLPCSATIGLPSQSTPALTPSARDSVPSGKQAKLNVPLRTTLVGIESARAGKTTNMQSAERVQAELFME